MDGLLDSRGCRGINLYISSLKTTATFVGFAMKFSVRLNVCFIYLLYGLILHLGFFVLLFPHKSVVHRPLPTVSVILNIQKKAKSKSVHIKINRDSHGGNQVQKKIEISKLKFEKNSPNSILSPVENSKIASKKYSSILPKPSDIMNVTTIVPSPDGMSSSKHLWGPSLQIDGKRVLLKRAGNLKALINIPLSARISLDHGKATARITRESKSQTLILKILQGEPLLRAILWEFLQSRATKEAIKDIFQTLNSQEFVIALHLKEGDHIKANDDSFSWRENRLDIYASRGLRGFTPRGFHWASGLSFTFTLPDEKADKAKEQDEDEYARLRESPAYVSILSDRIL